MHLTQSIQDIYASIHQEFSQVIDWENAFSAACASAEKLGFSYMIHAPVRSHPDASSNWTATTYPTEWQKIYAEKKYLQRNPVRTKTLSSHRPFTWGALEASLPKEQRELFHDCRATGMCDGVVVPVHGPNGMAMAVGFASAYAEAIHQEVLPVLSLIAHRLYHAQDIPTPQNSIHLTLREVQLMVFLADGMDNFNIANALCISENSVEWHLKNIYKKLDVKNRTAAVVKSLKLGLIQF
ncbi:MULTISPECIES: helix-turn-helix transcriptional regulator [Giesbergeria]|uniref:Autoinducer binding domain-containing protein n=1 Tax=Giesbergeria sinuosa TaxID=80883 RepID=A0ABV9QA95_9BURK